MNVPKPQEHRTANKSTGKMVEGKQTVSKITAIDVKSQSKAPYPRTYPYSCILLSKVGSLLPTEVALLLENEPLKMDDVFLDQKKAPWKLVESALNLPGPTVVNRREH